MIVIRSQQGIEPDSWPPELKQHFIETRDDVFHKLEKRSEKEKDMGVFQLLDALGRRMVGIAEERRKRGNLKARQAEIENHPLFIQRADDGN